MAVVYCLVHRTGHPEQSILSLQLVRHRASYQPEGLPDVLLRPVTKRAPRFQWVSFFTQNLIVVSGKYLSFSFLETALPNHDSQLIRHASSSKIFRCETAFAAFEFFWWAGVDEFATFGTTIGPELDHPVS